MAGSGLMIPSSPDTTMPSKESRNPYRWRTRGNVSADQLVSAKVGTPSAWTSSSTATVSSIAGPDISSHRSQ